MLLAEIESLDREGRGVAHVDGKTIFVDGALPGETVGYAPYRKKPNWELAQLLEVCKPSGERIEPRCTWYDRCGGCSMQHLHVQAQVAAKQRVLEDAFWHVGRVRPARMLSPICGPHWGYRHRARLSVRLVPKKGGILVGFHERRSSYVVQMSSCEVLPRPVSEAIPRLKELVEALSIRDRLPQIELAVGDRVSVLVMRVLEPPSDQDESLLRQFAEREGFQVWLQPKGPDTAYPFWPLDAAPLDYVLPEFDLRIGFAPTDFTQVNHAVNRVMVRRAMDLLQPAAGDRLADFFCGLGNFTLPMARSGASVFGVEGSAQLVRRAQSNAEANGLAQQCRFRDANLFDPEVCARVMAEAGPLDKVLIDPPREGAVEVVKALAGVAPRRIVYVACDPATLARDAGFLVHTAGYSLEAAGIVNMFPHTSHVESMALLERQG